MIDDLQVGEGLVVQARDQHRAAGIDLRAEQRGAEEIRKEDERVEAVAFGVEVGEERLRIDAARRPRELLVEIERKAVGEALLHGEEASDLALGDREAPHGHGALPLLARLQHVLSTCGDPARRW